MYDDVTLSPFTVFGFGLGVAGSGLEFSCRVYAFWVLFLGGGHLGGKNID